MDHGTLLVETLVRVLAPRLPLELRGSGLYFWPPWGLIFCCSLWMIWILIMALASFGFVALSKSCHFLWLQFLHLYSEPLTESLQEVSMRSFICVALF